MDNSLPAALDIGVFLNNVNMRKVIDLNADSKMYARWRLGRTHSCSLEHAQRL